MGYNTDFEGAVSIEPPLNLAEKNYLEQFANTRRMKRKKGPYFVGGEGMMGQGHMPDIEDYNMPPAGQPGLWCQWVPSDDGEFIEWNGVEKFYDSVEWMQYIIDHFLKPGAEAQSSNDPQFRRFTFDHVVNGEINAYGEESGDIWKLVVKDNEVREVRARLVWDDEN